MWWEWSGWAFIGNAAQVISLIAIVFAIYEILLRKRRVSWVRWALDPYEEASGPDLTLPAVRCDLVNLGLDDVRIHWIGFIGCEYVPAYDDHLRFRVNAGQTQLVVIQAADWDEPWVVIYASALTDHRVGSLTWLPVAPDSVPLVTELWRQQHAEARWPLRRRPPAVGPGPGRVRATRGRVMSKRWMEAVEREEDLIEELNGYTVRPNIPRPGDDWQSPPRI